MLLGEIGVGKTSIARRLAFDTFDYNYKATIGSDVYTYDIKDQAGDPCFRFLVWDTDGSFGSAILQHVYMRQAHAALVVGDISRPSTLDAMVALAETFYDKLPGRYIAFVINKVDLAGPTGVELPEKVRSAGLPICTTSALTGSNIVETFHEAAETIARREGL
ncbi:MAG: hypothetical protein RLZ98_3234 [Pseudomonadota bacterium]